MILLRSAAYRPATEDEAGEQLKEQLEELSCVSFSSFLDSSSIAGNTVLTSLFTLVHILIGAVNNGFKGVMHADEGYPD